MTTIQKGNCVFDIDQDKTRVYYSTRELCNCSGCRNFYAQIKEFAPKLDAFLSEFGVDICRPDETADVEMDGYLDYLFVGYTVTGRIKTGDRYETDIDSFHISISKGDTPYDWFPHEQTEPCFLISVSGISLPWVLDEPFPKWDGPFQKTERLRDKIKGFLSNLENLAQELYISLQKISR